MSHSKPRPAPEQVVIIVASKGLFRGADIKKLLSELDARNPWKAPGATELWSA